MKLEELLYDLTVKHILRKLSAFLYVIEFQRRGLPHVHVLINLVNEDKIWDKDDID